MKHVTSRPALVLLLAVALLGLHAGDPPSAHAQQRSPATGAPSGPGGADPALFRSSPLDPVSFVMAYHRLTGTTIDFRPFAERSTAVRNATTFDRPDALAREIARLDGAFTGLDLARPYLVRLGTRLRQYDGPRGGYPLDFDAEAYIPIQDPVTFRGFGLQFRNLDDIAVVPVGDTSAARIFAQRHSLNTGSDIAGDVLLEMVVRLAEALPAISSGVMIVRGDILAARVATRNGGAIWDYGPTAGRGPAPQAAAPGTAPLLKAADIQGVRVGMPLDEGASIASRAYPTERWRSEAGGRWFRNVAPGAEPTGFNLNRATAVRCGLDPLSGYDSGMVALQAGSADPSVADDSEACLGYDAARRDGPQPGGTINRVTSGQRLLGATPETVRQALTEKYGPPTYTRAEGRTLQWIGRDPARPDGSLVAITARIEPRQGGGVVLGVDAIAYVDPARRTAPASGPAPSAPRL